MSEHIRIINGFIEINYDRVAQILPNSDERELREKLVGVEDLEEQTQEAYEEGLAVGESHADDLIATLNDKIDTFLDSLLKDGTITKDQHDIICEGLPYE